MKSVGSVTMHYPLLSDGTISILEDIQRVAFNYYDFIARLGDFVCSTESTQELTYLASKHASRELIQCFLSGLETYFSTTGKKYNEVLSVNMRYPHISSNQNTTSSLIQNQCEYKCHH